MSTVLKTGTSDKSKIMENSWQNYHNYLQSRVYITTGMFDYYYFYVTSDCHIIIHSSEKETFWYPWPGSLTLIQGHLDLVKWSWELLAKDPLPKLHTAQVRLKTWHGIFASYSLINHTGSGSVTLVHQQNCHCVFILEMSIDITPIMPLASAYNPCRRRHTVFGTRWVQTLESRLSSGILNGKSVIQGPNLPEFQKCLLGMYKTQIII